MNAIPRGSYRARQFQIIISLLGLVGLLNIVTMAQARKQTIILAVTSESGEGSLDALAVLAGKQLLSPYGDEQKDRQKTFAEEYFKKGAVYRLIFGGGEAGSATVSGWTEGCNNVHAQATLSTSARLGGKVMALATNSETLGKRSMSRPPSCSP